MSTLLLRFAAPMQSWGARSQFEIRRTNREPTKSGAIGLLAAALGRRRDDSLEDLTGLKFGVRVDREGSYLKDFHVARKMKGKKSEILDKSYVTYRYYLCDAVFLVGFESGDERFLREIEEAVNNPSFPLFLGRRSCPPEGKVCLGIRTLPLEEALTEEPLLVENVENLRFILDADKDDAEKTIVRDVPKSFDPHNRKYEYRYAKEKIVHISLLKLAEHDPMAELE